MRIIAALHETGRAAYLSHLDMQRTLQRALRRADMPLMYSQGFNPHPQIAIALYGEKVAHGSTLAYVAEEIVRAYFDVGEGIDITAYENGLS